MVHPKEQKKWLDDLVPEIVLFPTYFVIVLIVLGKFDSSPLVTLPALIFSSLVLEFIYRAVFGEKRHNFSCRVMAFVAQCIVWGLIFYFDVFGIWK